MVNVSFCTNSTGLDNHDDDLSPVIASFIEVTYSVVLPTLCLCGLLGNILNLVVLCSPGPAFRHSMYTYVRWIAIADIAVMIFWFPVIAKFGWNADITNIHAASYHTHLAFPIINIFVAASSLLVVALTVERYISICFPLRAQRFRTDRKLVKVLIVATSFILPAIFDIPVIFGKYVAREPECFDRVTFRTHKLPYKQSFGYTVIYNWIKVAVLTILPVLLVAILNSVTMAMFQNRWKFRQGMMGEAQNQRAGREERRLTALLLAIIVLYDVCMTPNAVFQVLHYTVYRNDSDNAVYQTLRAVANILITTNSALNFYIYCVAGRHFRHVLIRRFCCRSVYDILIPARTKSMSSSLGSSFSHARNSTRNASKRGKQDTSNGQNNGVTPSLL